MDDVSQPLRPAEIRAVLASLEVSPYKGWGQHFLTDPTVPGQMVQLAEIGPGDAVLEIGPGLGILTAPLLASGAAVTAVEIDPRLTGFLRDRFGTRANFRLVESDILRLRLGELMPAGPYSVVANLPYAITSAVLRHVLERDDRPARLVLMVQEEVARRIVATPPEMSILAVSVQLYGQPRLALRVPASSFTPVPRVNSAVISLRVEPSTLSEAEQSRFFRVVTAGFRQRRKTLANALMAGLAQPRPALVAVLEAAGIEPLRRAETLTVPEWLRVYRAVETARAASAA